MSGRILLVALILFIGLLAIVGRVVQLTVIEGEALAALAAGQHRKRVIETPPRGTIVDRNSRRLAFSLGAESLFVHPSKVSTSVSGMSEVLAESLGLPAYQITAAINSSAPFVWLKRGVSRDTAAHIKGLQFPGIGSIPTQRRVYPHGNLAASVLGFVNVDAKGIGGLEVSYDRYLLGKARGALGERDARGRMILADGGPTAPEIFKVKLALDAKIQYIAERELRRAVSDTGARAGSVTIIDPKTFGILALAQMPSFDPHFPGRYPAGTHRNRVVSDCYEPGSTVKALLVAAALDTGEFGETDPIFCEHGAYRIGRHTIHDVHPHGDLTVHGVLTRSSNIGAVKIGAQLGTAVYHRYLQTFGFGGKTGVDLPGEIAGILPSAQKWSTIRLATASFGQGIAVTPLQLISAYGALANGGTLMRPHLVTEVSNEAGKVIFKQEPTVIRQVIEPATAARVRNLLAAVVEPGGTGWRAQVAGFRVAGKTGTSQKIDPGGGYSAKGRIASFIGMVPADRPRIVVLVVIDEPKTSVYGGTVAAPVFQAVARDSLIHLGVPSNLNVGSDVELVRNAVSGPMSVEKAKVPSLPDTTTSAGATEQRLIEDDFLGLSLRAAMRKAYTNGLKITVSGSGYVTRQIARMDSDSGGRVYELILENGL